MKAGAALVGVLLGALVVAEHGAITSALSDNLTDVALVRPSGVLARRVAGPALAKSPSALRLAAAAAVARKDWPEADRQLNAYIGPSSSLVVGLRASIDEHLGRPAKSLADWQAVPSWQQLVRESDALATREEWALAIDGYERSVSVARGQQRWISEQRLAQAIWQGQRDYPTASGMFARSLEDGGNGDVALEWAHAARAAGRPDEARDILLREQQHDPAAYQPLLGLAELEADAGRTAEAVSLIDQAAARQPRSEEVWSGLAQAQLKAGDSSAALASAGRAAELAPNAAGPLILMAQALSQQGKLDEAYARCQQARQVEPGNGFAWLCTARALLGMGRQSEALTELRGLDAAYSFDDFTLALADALEAAHDPENAAAAYRRILSRTPGQPLAAARLQALMSQGGLR